MDDTRNVARAPLPQAAPSSGPKQDPRIALLPKVPGALAERLGYHMGLLLIEKFGGQTMRVPTHPERETVLSRALGEEAARLISELFGGESIEVPRVAKKLAATHLRRCILEHPGSNNEAARDLDVSCRYVRQVRADARKAVRRERLKQAFDRDAKRLAGKPATPSSSTAETKESQ